MCACKSVTEHGQLALCAMRSHGTELIMLGHKLLSGTFKTKESRAGLERVPLFWKSHCVTCVTGSCKGPTVFPIA